MASNTQTKTLTAKKISQPNAYKGGNLSNNAHYTKSDTNCSFWGGTSIKCYRQWNHPEEIIKGNKTQCGSTEGSNYGGEVQHIGGPTGDLPTPALLHIYDFNSSSFLNESSKIHGVEVTFSYRLVNVTKSGHLWINNLAKDEYAIIRGVSAWWGSADKKTKLSSVVKNSTKIKYEGKKKDGSYIWKTITLKFDDISGADFFNNNFALNLQFGMNCPDYANGRTPCFLYINNFKISVEYENSSKYIEGSNSSNTLYTSQDNGCYTEITQTIEAGYKNGSTKISPSKAPEKLGSKIILQKAPSGVTVTKTQSNDSKAYFKIQDKTNIEGEKTVTYCLSNDKSTKVNLRYQAIKRPKPTYSVVEEYKANEDFNPNKAYIIFKNGCASQIKMYIDGINNTPITLNVTNQNSTVNLLSPAEIERFHNIITQLSCGYHTLYFQIGNESINDAKNNKVTIKISPMEYKFKVYSENYPDLTFLQQKRNNRYDTVKIQRIDNEPREVIPSIKIIDETRLDNEDIITNVAKGDIIDHEIDKYFAGDFYIKIIDNISNCVSQDNVFAKITIISNHKQNYDYLFTRGEDGTAFDFDYLVAWEGDNIKSPILNDEIEFKQSPNDIRFCSNFINKIGLSQIGLIELKVSNKTENDVFENINIELNTLIEDDDGELDVTTDEWTSPNGIFNDFYNLFYDYNQTLNDNLEIKNLTPDNDLVDEENVYLIIKKIDPGDTLTIYLPYRCTKEKTVYLQYLLFEQPHPIHSIEECDSIIADTSDMITIKVIDSMLTQLEILGNTDLLSLDTTVSCPNECYSTKTDDNDEQSGGITYRITNVDSSNFDNNVVQTEIYNSNELQPYGYIINGTYYNLYDENGNLRNDIHDNIEYIEYIDEEGNTQIKEMVYNNKIEWKQEKQILNKPIPSQLIYANVNFPLIDSQTVIQKTNYKGMAEFYITIPEELDKSYTITELLNEVITFEYKGNDDYLPAISSQEIKLSSDDKDTTILTYGNNYRRYKPGETAYIPVFLSVNLSIMINKIIFNASLYDNKSFDEVTILYKICNIDNNQGIFKTKFMTNDDLLIPQQVQKEIYCGINSDIVLDTKIEKEVIESENINVVYINVKNQRKINKDVSIEVNLGKQLDISDKYIFEGDYDFLDINIDAGDYAISEDEDQNIIITWLLGEMDIYQINKGIIKIKARDIGLSDIRISAFDYLHIKDEADNKINNTSKCNQCPQTTYKIKDSPWEIIDGVAYKLINGVYYRRIFENGISKWVTKDE